MTYILWLKSRPAKDEISVRINCAILLNKEQEDEECDATKMP
jgi:hypothetical protein